MPEAAAIGSMWQVRVVGSIEGQQTNNVLNFTCTGGTADVETHLILVLIQCIVTSLIPVVSSAWKFERVVWKQVSPALGPEFTTIPSGTPSGGGSAAALPSYSSVVLSIRTAFGGKSGRGRLYLAGIPEGVTNGSLIDGTSAFWTALLAFVTCLITNFKPTDPTATNSFVLGVYSRKIGGAAFPFGASGWHAVTSITPSLALGTTRSRKVGRGS